ncbi:low-specificity L-threonine aldolase [Haloplasma contractile]|uniref:Threonine aldolase protein n=1 Tax=Haloplasma contractile SSD-17B TaxID=1033810 RepID=U2E9S2_9MOLU|nr:low-specificity L-threonine aldolase [Haloplasma contractile]ERJ11586.1 threonine aldolase protein [Haloplasma contractile SSD-17B]
MVMDLRSDTVTQPTKEMREAMANAIVGDDVYEDDPTVKQLEILAAKMVGKEAALFVPSGTFGNQLALLTHTNRGDEVILEANSHIKKYEVASSAVIAGVQLHTIEGELGKMNLDQIKGAIRGEDIHFPSTTLICLENAVSNGTVLDVDYMKSVYELAKSNNLNVHLDGARVFNASTSLGVEVSDICQYTDTVMFCLSKGLCAPIGSMIAGSESFIKKARKNRKLMGGGLRQVGILASSGIIALEKMSKRLKEDHDNAHYLAEKLDEIEGVRIIKNRRDINMVFIQFDENLQVPKDFTQLLLEKDIKIGGYTGDELRFVTHNGISKETIDHVVDSMKIILQAKQSI